MKRNLTYAAAAVLLSLTLLSCSVRQQLYVRNDGAGALNTRVDLSPMLVEYLRDLGELREGSVRGEGGGAVRIFDIEQIKKTVDGLSELRLISAQNPEDGVLITSVLFNNIKQVFHDNLGSDIKPAARSVTRGNKTVLDLSLDRDNYRKIVHRFIKLSALDEFGPYITSLLEPGPEETIIEMYEYAFEEYTEEKTVKELIRNSKIIMDVYVDGTITDYSEGEKLEGTEHFTTGIRLSIPLIDVLTLDRPIHYEIPFEPNPAD